MLDTIDHRGPDGSDSWCDNRIALGHQRFQSTPESRFDSQPYRSDGLVITGDVRIDNRNELLDKLSFIEPAEKISDIRIVLEAYRKWGNACTDYLIGAFAFVIWDEDHLRLFVARDRFGVKPLYYHLTSDVLAVASEKKALLTLPSVATDIDETKIGDFLIALYEDKERTFFESLRRLPPAHTMSVGSETTETRQYWNLDPTRTITLESDAAYERRFRELLDQAVRSRLRASGPIGTSLSGGMDSSSITVIARDLLPETEPLHTFSNVYDDAPTSDEREFIEAVTAGDGIESHYIFPEGMSVLVDEDRLRTYVDQPPHNTMNFAVWERTKRAAEEDVSVVLGGELGDSAIGYGLGLLPELFWTGRWPYLYKELRAMSDIVNAPVKHLFVRHVLSNFVPERVDRMRRRYRGDPLPLMDENPTLSPAFVDRIGLRDRYEDKRLRGSTFSPRARGLQCRSLLTGRNTTNFEAVDQIFAAFGVEPRFPFTDSRLVEFSLAIPATQQFKDGWTRSIVRRSLSDVLPEKVQWRPWKTAVNEAFWNALSVEDDRLGTLIANPGPLARYVDPDSLDDARARFNEDPNSRDGRALWRALSLSVWLDEFYPAAATER